MAGIDGWSLVEMLRGIPATARMPIAMMAGVLDTVDPERIKEAPIQGFLKKPVELRELGDRIARLMETPVPLPEPTIPKLNSPFATMPATRLDDLPEFRQKQEAAAQQAAGGDRDGSGGPPGAHRGGPLSGTGGDLGTAEESLDLEELDLDNLRGLSLQPEEAPLLEPMASLPLVQEAGASEPTPQEGAWPVEQLDAIATLDRLPMSEVAMGEVELPDLGAPTEELMDISSLSNLPELEEVVTAEEVPITSLLEEPREEVSFTPPLPPLEESLDWSDDSDSMLAAVETFEPPVVMEGALEADGPGSISITEAQALPEDELDLLDVSLPELTAEAAHVQLEAEGAAPLLEETAAVAAPDPEAPEPALAASALAASALAASVPAEAIVESALLETAAAPAEELHAAPVLESLAPSASVGSRELPGHYAGGSGPHGCARQGRGGPPGRPGPPRDRLGGDSGAGGTPPPQLGLERESE